MGFYIGKSILTMILTSVNWAFSSEACFHFPHFIHSPTVLF